MPFIKKTEKENLYFLEVKSKEFIGKRFSKLTIISVSKNKHRGLDCIAKCDCGQSKKYILGHLKNGHTTSCGCHRLAALKKATTTHGLSRHPIMKLWRSIKSRCYYEKSDNFKYYGGQGVIMCEEWLNNFLSFYDWAIKNGYMEGLELDKDILAPTKTGKIYCPEFCCFVTHKENMNKTSVNRILNIDGEKLTLKQASEKFNLNYDMLKWRIQSGWDDYLACHTPSRKTSSSLP